MFYEGIILTNLSIVQKFLLDPTKAEARNNLAAGLALTGIRYSFLAYGCACGAVASLVSSIAYPMIGSFGFAISATGFLVGKDIVTICSNLTNLLQSYSGIPALLTTELLVNSILKNTSIAHFFLEIPLAFFLNQPVTLENFFRA